MFFNVQAIRSDGYRKVRWLSCLDTPFLDTALTTCLVNPLQGTAVTSRGREQMINWFPSLVPSRFALLEWVACARHPPALSRCEMSPAVSPKSSRGELGISCIAAVAAVLELSVLKPPDPCRSCFGTGAGLFARLCPVSSQRSLGTARGCWCPHFIPLSSLAIMI